MARGTSDDRLTRNYRELSPHTDIVTDAAWSPSGNLIASIGRDKRLLIHQAGVNAHVHDRKFPFPLMHVDFIDEARIALCDFNSNLRIYDWHQSTVVHSMRMNVERTYAMSLSHITSTVALGFQNGMIEFARVGDHQITPLTRRMAVPGSVWQLNWSVAGDIVYASCARSGVFAVDFRNGALLERFLGSGTFAISEQRRVIAVFQRDFSIRVYGLDGRRFASLEGNSSRVARLMFTSDGSYLLSKSTSGQCFIWDTGNWQLLSETHETTLYPRFPLSGSPVDPHKLLTTGSMQKSIVIRVLRETSLPAIVGGSNPRYKNAKVVLMGETGVGKSALAHQLLGHGWRLTESSHGRQVERLVRELQTSEYHEVYLWDLAGQPNYHLIHQLHLDEISVALILFDDRAERDPFARP